MKTYWEKKGKYQKDYDHEKGLKVIREKINKGYSKVRS